MPTMKIGVIGIGAFGSRVAKRLIWNGFPDLQVYDTHEQTPRVFTAEAGGMAAGSPAMMANMCDVIITALPSAFEMREVFFGWEGLSTGFKKDGIVIDVGLTDPDETVAMGKELAADGVQLVDAPAFGTPYDAKDGKLTMIVGGEDSAVARCQPIFDTLASRVIRAGGTGSAQAAGAIADYMRAARLMAASEAIRLGGAFGFEPARLLEVCGVLGGDALPGMLEAQVATRKFKSGMQLGLLRANVELAARLAKSSGRISPLLDATHEALVRAEDRLGYSEDQSAILKWLETLAPEPVKGAEAAVAANPAAETKTGPA